MSKRRKFLRKELFWDTQFDKLDFEKNENLIIQRVIDFGTWEEFLEMVKFYGSEKVKNETIINRELSNQGIYFVSHYFKIKIEKFKCYKKRQSNPIHFHF